eukprot:3186985-Amphidinium_carterae.1
MDINSLKRSSRSAIIFAGTVVEKWSWGGALCHKKSARRTSRGRAMVTVSSNSDSGKNPPAFAPCHNVKNISRQSRESRTLITPLSWVPIQEVVKNDIPADPHPDRQDSIFA